MPPPQPTFDSFIPCPPCNPYVVLPPGDCVNCGPTPECCQWCNKSAVLSQVAQNMGGNPCAKPDIIVDVRGFATAFPGGCAAVDPSKVGTDDPATCSIQAAVDYINLFGDLNGDGFLFIGVTASDCTGGPLCGCAHSRPASGDTPFGIENVVVENMRPQRLNIFGCSVTIHAADASLPVITIKNGVGKVTVLDLHVKNSLVAGYLVQNNNDLVVVKNSRAIGDGSFGYRVVDDNVQITGSPEISGNDIGVLLDGNNNILRTNNSIQSNRIGIQINGAGNESNGNDVGRSGKPNSQIGINVLGSNNDLHDDNVTFNTALGINVGGNGNMLDGEDVQHNGGNGIVVSGASNVLEDNRRVENNGGDGFSVSGNMNMLDGNTASRNSGNGYDVSGNLNNFDQNDAEDNGGDGFHVTGSNNTFTESSAEGNGGDGMDAGGGGNRFQDNDARDNTGFGIRACGQLDLGGNSAEDNGLFPEIDFVCPAGPAAFFVADDSDDQVYLYNAAGAVLSRFNLNSANDAPNGVAAFGGDIYILDKSDKKVYRYNSAGTLTGTSRVLRELGGGSLSSPSGLAIAVGIAGTDMWLADDSNKKAYRYSLAVAFGVGGNLNAAQQIVFSAGVGNDSCEGLAIDATSLYVLDDSDKKFYRYPRAGGAGVAGKVLRDNVGSNLSSPSGADLNVGSGSIFLVDKSKKRVYTYPTGSVIGAGNLNASTQFSLHPDNGDPKGM